jgi:hypothetical protein
VLSSAINLVAENAGELYGRWLASDSGVSFNKNID